MLVSVLVLAVLAAAETQLRGTPRYEECGVLGTRSFKCLGVESKGFEPLVVSLRLQRPFG